MFGAISERMVVSVRIRTDLPNQGLDCAEDKPRRHSSDMSSDRSPRLDPVARFDDVLGPPEVGVGRHHVVQALIVTLVVVVFEEGFELGLEITGQEVTFGGLRFFTV